MAVQIKRSTSIVLPWERTLTVGEMEEFVAAAREEGAVDSTPILPSWGSQVPSGPPIVSLHIDPSRED